MSECITPYLPEEAKIDARLWQRSGEHNVAFVRALPRSESGGCQNCGDRGVVYVTFAVGPPTRTPKGIARPSCWFDGDGRVAKGWYEIDRTRAFPCPHCVGGARGDEPTQARPTAEEIRKLADAKQIDLPEWQEW